MELTILGSGTAVPSLTRGAPGALLTVGGQQVVIDAGPGTLTRLLAAGLTHDQVTHILITHNHLDHCGELASWLFTARVPGCSRTAPLTICGSSGFMRMLSGLKQVYGHRVEPAGYTLTLVTMDAAVAAPLAFDGWTVQAFPVAHIDSSLGYRITDDAGTTFACTGDTDVCDGALLLARDADLLLIEASTPGTLKLEGHLTAAEAGTIARRAGARKVVLHHFYPPCDEADMLGELRRTYDGNAVLAEDGMRLSP